MRMLVAGSSGFTGARLLAEAALNGVETCILKRAGAAGALVEPGKGQAWWNPARGELPDACIQNIDTIVNLCGAGIADKRWNGARKRELLESRLAATRTLVDACARSTVRPKVLLNASAVGFYGDGGSALLDEGAAKGSGFLSALCEAWEAEALRAERLGMRVVFLRTGMVLGEEGGALSRLLPVFRRGLGGPLGAGDTWMSWISNEDLARSILHIAQNSCLEGAVNTVSPEPILNADFTRSLAASLGVHAPFRVPVWALRLGLGEMAKELFLSSCRAVPNKLVASGFQFRHQALEPWLCSLFQL